MSCNKGVSRDPYVFANLPRAANTKIKAWNFRFGIRHETDSPNLKKMMREVKAKLEGQKKKEEEKKK